MPVGFPCFQRLSLMLNTPPPLPQPHCAPPSWWTAMLCNACAMLCCVVDCGRLCVVSCRGKGRCLCGRVVPLGGHSYTSGCGTAPASLSGLPAGRDVCLDGGGRDGVGGGGGEEGPPTGMGPSDDVEDGLGPDAEVSTLPCTHFAHAHQLLHMLTSSCTCSPALAPCHAPTSTCSPALAHAHLTMPATLLHFATSAVSSCTAISCSQVEP